MRLLTPLDFVDVWFKIKERGLYFVAKKLISNTEQRIKSTWNEDTLPSSNWWQVNKVRARWNMLITGDENTLYPDYFVNKYLKNKTRLQLLSIGCGTGKREIEFAKHACFEQVLAIDIAPKTIQEAHETAKALNLKNCTFAVADVYKESFESSKFDVVLFHSSLHHFSQIDKLLTRIRKTLKPDGLLIINEYVGANRFQYDKARMNRVAKVYQTVIPEKFKKRKFSNSIKKRVYFPGLLRMVIADPSEAVEANSILSILSKQFTLLEQKNYGGNLLTFALKDIAHNFNTDDATPVLQKLFALEDELMKEENKSDYVFAVYKNNLG